MIALLPGFLHKGEVKQELGPAVGDRHEKAFEAKHAFVFKMGIYSADIFHRLPALVKVGVIYYKAGLFTLMLAADATLGPKLTGETPQHISPFYGRVLYETDSRHPSELP